MNKSAIETAVGVFVIIGIVCISYLTVKLGNVGWFNDNYYALTARFDSVSGLTSGASVEMSGVEIGEVAAITLDLKDQVALVELRIRKEIALTDDVIASVKTAGLIGDKYINISPGGSDLVLKPGDAITETESAIDLEALISKYVFGDV
jgi:phospholipid/cholesterol/gamma-HCH transport system substrate-binding protein